jgi:lactate dehydrogenase-like 2-hydroxyacid dehydrogenase
MHTVLSVDEAKKKKGIVVFNTPGANANGVKELVILGMLLTCRKVTEGIAWAKGLEEKVTVRRHALKNALIPVVTIIGLQIAVLMGGSVIIDAAFLKSGDFAVTSCVHHELKVRVYGDAAVVTGRDTIIETYKGKDVSGQHRWTHTWVKRAGSWHCVAGHSSEIAQKKE